MQNQDVAEHCQGEGRVEGLPPEQPGHHGREDHPYQKEESEVVPVVEHDQGVVLHVRHVHCFAGSDHCRRGLAQPALIFPGRPGSSRRRGRLLYVVVLGSGAPWREGSRPC